MDGLTSSCGWNAICQASLPAASAYRMCDRDAVCGSVEPEGGCDRPDRPFVRSRDLSIAGEFLCAAGRHAAHIGRRRRGKRIDAGKQLDDSGLLELRGACSRAANAAGSEPAGQVVSSSRRTSDQLAPTDWGTSKIEEVAEVTIAFDGDESESICILHQDPKGETEQLSQHSATSRPIARAARRTLTGRSVAAAENEKRVEVPPRDEPVRWLVSQYAVRRLQRQGREHEDRVRGWPSNFEPTCTHGPRRPIAPSCVDVDCADCSGAFESDTASYSFNSRKRSNAPVVFATCVAGKSCFTSMPISAASAGRVVLRS